jgi:hypothetical protein
MRITTAPTGSPEPPSAIWDPRALRPPRPDIAAPPWPAGLEWVGGEARPMEHLTAKGPVLVHFFDFAQLNSARALPYVLEWESRYGPLGLSVIGVHAPRFSFTRDPAAVATAVECLGISHPVALDTELRVWRDYGPHGWPALFIWGKGGVLRWYHLGEGEYAASEEVIRAELAEADGNSGELPEVLEPLRATDAPGAEVVAPTAEIFPGGSPSEPWRGGGGELEVEYAAGGAYGSVDGEGTITVSIDGEPSEVAVTEPGLVELSSHENHQAHSLRVRATGGLEIYSLSFAPGVPGGR